MKYNSITADISISPTAEYKEAEFENAEIIFYICYYEQYGDDKSSLVQYYVPVTIELDENGKAERTVVVTVDDMNKSIKEQHPEYEDVVQFDYFLEQYDPRNAEIMGEYGTLHGYPDVKFYEISGYINQ